MSELFSVVNVYKSARTDPRARAIIWILTSLIWIAVGIKAILRHKLDDIGWLIAPAWGFCLMIWLCRLYQACQDRKHQEAARKSLEEHPWQQNTQVLRFAQDDSSLRFKLGAKG